MANVIEVTIKGIDKFSRAAQKVSKSMVSLAKTVLKFAVAAVAAGTAVLVFTKKIAGAMDKTTKFSTRLGISVQELTRMQFAANQAGISTDQFNMATQRMTRRVAEASKGMGEAKGALQELGIDARSFSRLGVEEQFYILADALNEVKSPADQLRLAFKLFDSEGTAVLQMLKEGSPAMRALAEDAEYLGIVFGDQAAANATKFQDEMGRLGQATKGTGMAIAEVLMPVLSGLAKMWTKSTVDSRKAIVSFVKSAVRNIFFISEVVGQFIDGVVKAFSTKEGFKNFLVNLKAFGLAAAAMMGAIVVALFQAVWEGLKLITNLLLEFSEEWGKILQRIWSGEITDVDQMAAAYWEAFEKAWESSSSAALENLSKTLSMPFEVFRMAAADAGSAFLSAFSIDLDKAADEANAFYDELVALGTADTGDGFVSSIVEGLDIAGIAMDEWMIVLGDKYKTWVDQLSENSTVFANSLFNTINTGIDNLSKGIADTITEGGKLVDMFKAVAKSIVNNLIAAVVKWGLQRVLSNFLADSSDRSTSMSQAGRAAALAGANGVASWAKAPWPINSYAPAFGAAMFKSSASFGVLAGAAHGGLEDVPREGTFLLNKGERVLSPNQNSDLTNFLGSNDGGGGGINIENLNVEVLPNATNADSLLRMRREEIEEVVAGPIIDALNSLDGKGIRPVFAERTRR